MTALLDTLLVFCLLTGIASAVGAFPPIVFVVTALTTGCVGAAALLTHPDQ